MDTNIIDQLEKFFGLAITGYEITGDCMILNTTTGIMLVEMEDIHLAA